MKENTFVESPLFVPPLIEWPALFAQADTSLEPEFADWDCTLLDGLDEAP